MPNGTSQSVTLHSGVSLNYRIDGPANGNWIILSNALATTLHLFDFEVAYLSYSMRVLRYDTRGHGKSSAVKPPYQFHELCDDVVGLMDYLNIEKADMLGVSLGGMTALAMGLTHPNRINRIVCCNARADAPASYKALWDANIDRLHSENLMALCEPTLTRWFTKRFLDDPANKEKLANVRLMFNTTAPKGYEGCARCYQTLDLLASLGRLSHKTLYVAGESDLAAPAALMQAMSAATPNGSFKMIHDAAHLSNLEKPEHFSRIVRSFLWL